MQQHWFRDALSLIDGSESSTGLATRRMALGAAVGMGYAAAAGPVMAQTAIRTPAEGLVSGEVTIDVNGFRMPAYRCAPAGRTGLPVVLVISEIFGVHEYIADVTRRLARAGYLAIAPELFVRQGDPNEYGELAKLLSEVIAKVPDAQVMGDLRVDGLIATNTTIDRSAVAGHPLAGEAGGLSGTPLYPKSTAVLKRLAESLPPGIPLIGVGGISRGEDAVGKVSAGATLVQFYTGFVYHGPALITACVEAIRHRRNPPRP